jgi:hypothetical protein
MKSKIKLTPTVLVALLSACASDPIDPLDPTQGGNSDLQPQCPIGYEPVYSTEIVIKSTDDNKKTGKPQRTFRCEPIR